MEVCETGSLFVRGVIVLTVFMAPLTGPLRLLQVYVFW